MFQCFIMTIYRICATGIAFHLGSKRKDKTKFVVSMIIVGIIITILLFDKVE